MNNQTTEMTATVVNNQVQITVENYREQLDVPTISTIDNLIADNHYINDMIDFINEHGAANFFNYYEEYVEQGEDYSYSAVDVFVDEFGIENVQYFQDAYQGSYSSEEDFAEDFINGVYGDVPAYLVVDWTATWEQNLQYDFTFNNGFVFNKNF